MKIHLGIVGLFLVLVLILWLTTPSSPWSTEGFDLVNTQVIKGRYIRLERKQVGCMNLAGIEVYSEKDGKNIIQPSTVVTKSSMAGNPDPAPPSHFVDGNADTHIHNNCGDNGWILVDLGSIMPIYKIVITNRKDCCRQRANGTILSILDDKQMVIYVANPIKDKKNRVEYAETAAEQTDMTNYYYTFTYFPPYPVPFGDLSPNMTMDPPSSIDSVPGWLAQGVPISDPVPMHTNETAESCRQMALNGAGKYVAWGYRKDNHPAENYKNTCYLYHDEMKPFSGNPQDNIHLTGCLRPGEKVELGCKVPNDPKSYQPYDRLKCRTLSTPWNDEGGGNAVYLDRHDVRCEPNEMLGQFHLAREANEKGATGRYRYDYTCCKVASPAFSEDSLPSTIKALPDQITELRQQQQKLSNPSLPPAIQEAPTKLAALEGEVQRIQQQLQKSSGAGSASAMYQSSPASISSSVSSPSISTTQSASLPIREDIVPENKLSQTGATALKLGNQSSLLRDIQQVIRNEIYADRATTPLDGFL